jgi:hypothetical protein
MINELSTEPFSKINAMGMLNTVLPPMQHSARLPSPILTAEMLQEEREGFFNYIRLVQKNGPDVLEPVINLHKGPNDENGWPELHKVLDKYTRAAKQMIDDCLATTGPETFDRFADDESRKSKKTDSGVSFGSNRRPSNLSTVQEKPLPEPMSSYTPAPKSLSKLERITREFKRMRVKSRPEVEEIVQINPRSPIDSMPQPITSSGKKSLKKAKSLASLKFGNGSSLSVASRQGSDAAFNPAQMAKHRAMYEARNGHA